MTTQLKERPVIFTAEEVNAVLAGDKTQHRIPCLTKEQVLAGFSYDFNAIDNAAIFLKVVDDEVVDDLLVDCPFGADGGRLWVQEEHRPIGWLLDDGEVMIEYRDGYSTSYNYLTEEELETNPNDDYPLAVIDELLARKIPINGHTDRFDFSNPENLPHWRSADVMPQFASRVLLEITDIRIERVQDTSHDDAVAEGVHHFNIGARLRDQPLSVAQIVFSRHWDDKHQDDYDIWEDNPWIWVVEFKKVDD